MTRTRVSVIALLTLMLARPLAAQQPLDPALIKEVQRLLELTGELKMGQQVAQMAAAQTLEAFKARGGGIPPRVGELVNEIMQAEVKAAFDPGGWLAVRIAEIYARYFTVDEIRGLIAFYESPLGRKITLTLPNVAQDSMKAAMDWAEKELPAMQKRFEERLRAEGIIKTP